MFRSALYAFVLTALAAPAVAAARPGGPEGPIRIGLLVDAKTGRLEVGEATTVRLVIRNTGPGPVRIVDWTRNPRTLELALRITDRPSVPAAAGASAEAPAVAARSTWAAPSKDWFLELAPGETVVERTLTPLVPGWAEASARLASTTELYRDASGDEVTLPGAWLGQASASVRLPVSGEMPDALKARYEAHRKRVTDPSVPVGERTRLLAEAAAGRHYFAARFVREVYQALAPGPVRAAALEHLVELATFGTAYEAMPVLVGAMTSGETPTETRLALVDWVAGVLARRGVQPVADQAVHVYAEPLRDQARSALRRLVFDGDAAVAARAREVVESWEKDD